MRVRIHLACLENRRCSVPFWAGIARPRKGEDAGDVAWAPVVRGRRRPGVRGEAKHREGGGGDQGREAAGGGGRTSRGGVSRLREGEGEIRAA